MVVFDLTPPAQPASVDVLLESEPSEQDAASSGTSSGEAEESDSEGELPGFDSSDSDVDPLLMSHIS